MRPCVINREVDREQVLPHKTSERSTSHRGREWLHPVAIQNLAGKTKRSLQS